MQSSITYMLSLGDTVILTPDLATMRESVDEKPTTKADTLPPIPSFVKPSSSAPTLFISAISRR
jgi:hypothetical protein